MDAHRVRSPPLLGLSKAPTSLAATAVMAVGFGAAKLSEDNRVAIALVCGSNSPGSPSVADGVCPRDVRVYGGVRDDAILSRDPRLR